MPTPTITMTVRVRVELYEYLRRVSKAKDISLNEASKQAFEEYCTRANGGKSLSDSNAAK